ncbi:hypothetical protein Lesp02_84890 [Lentzea sp. NBRC 105346]|uniref:FkbM family methyltransferase n=1 Tax=Lentzea sp. NBRC 105346 TaxID=3032205 RepID=UPI0024A294EE|nr:FkbM family methyltransferase [Lentzea sp. NBRC 105346]GLZ36302.1 hypothetical protein Lesp02_84890 [Lentzea sp. NBRC 105346]
MTDVEVADTFVLPDGRDVWCPNATEAEAVWAEMGADSPYVAAARGLRSGDVVIDVGAHVGMASMVFADTAPGVEIYAFEPAPATADCLQRNLAAHVPAAVVLRQAVGARPGTHSFTYYPVTSSRSTLYVDDIDDELNQEAYFTNQAVPEADRDIIRQLNGIAVQLTVDVTTVSDLVRANGLRSIGLLKIDVERAEHEVLRGVSDSDWPLVRRVLIEVHDIDGRLGHIVARLATLGFSVTTTQPGSFRGGSVYTVLASRPA